jgi:anaerobic selenocysteine-containing dehydrogenase
VTLATTSERLSYCRLCVAACGIVVTLDGDERVVKVRGDADHPVSRGYVCPKGRGLAAWHESDDRLSVPRLRGRQAAWTEVLDDLAASLARILAAGDPSAIAMYQATGMGFDAAGATITAQWLRSLHSRSYYSAVTVDNAPVLVAAELVGGNSRLNPMWSPTRPGLLVLVGHNPVVSHGYGNALPDPVRYLREFRGRGGRIWVLDPRRTETASLADEHLAIRPGGDISVLAAVARELLVDGADRVELASHCRSDDVAVLRAALDGFTIERAADAADVPVERIRQLVAALRAHPGALNLFTGTGVMMGPDGVLVEWLRWVLLILTGSLDSPAGMHFHDGLQPRLRPSPPDGKVHPGPRSRPDLAPVVRQMPVLGLVDEIEAGNVRALFLCGGDPLSAAPEPDRTREALSSLDTLVVIDVHDGELCELATHVLPATGQLERADVSMFAQMSMTSSVQYTGPVVAPRGERRPVWWILGHLARRMGGDVLRGSDPDAMTDEHFLRDMLAAAPVDVDVLIERGPRGMEVPVEIGWVRRDLLLDGCWNLAPPELVGRLAEHEPPGPGLVLTTRREMGWINSHRYGGPGTEPIVRMHPGDLADAGLPDGTRACVRSAHGSVEVTVAADERVRRGVVSMTHGRRGASPGSLVSRLVDVDPLTAMPRASALPVTVSAATAAH